MLTLLIVTGCNPYPGPPRYSISNPIAVIDDSGEVFVTYQINYGSDFNYKRTSYIQKLGAGGEKLWGEKGTELASDRGGYDGKSELIFAMPVLHDDGSISVISTAEDSIVFHKLNPDGRHVLPPVTLAAFYGRTPSLKVMDDGNDGAIAAFISDNNSISLLHIDSEGIILRRTDIPAPGLDTYNDFDMECDSSGNIIIKGKEGGFRYSTGDEDLPVCCNPVTGNASETSASVWKKTENRKPELRAQCLDGAGNKLWDEEGVVVSSIRPYWVNGPEPARITPDGNGGFYITWAAGNEIKDKTSSYIQRISLDGELLWGKDGIRLDG